MRGIPCGDSSNNKIINEMLAWQQQLRDEECNVEYKNA